MSGTPCWRLCPAQDAASMYRMVSSRLFTKNRSSDKHDLSYGNSRERHRRWPPGLVPEVFDSVAKILGRLWPGYAAAAALSLVLSIDARHNVNSYQF
ncbi:hypothetical protein B0H11DRAFT_2190333 [Mycena galericulata]|nr:hypothetical protein B0H11DRAFT_2190333 [Mycena galericulata]